MVNVFRLITRPANIQLVRKCSSDVRVRFAPSPTGQLHIGGFRTAFYNYLFAKKHGGTFVLRLEDTDQSRLVPGAAELMEETLEWSGLEIDESPKKGGPFGPYKQSERLDHYHKAVDSLMESGKAYRCFCSEKRLDLLRKEAARNKTNNKYDGRCRNLSADEIKAKLQVKIPFTIRLKLDPTCDGVFEDVIYGTTKHNPYENEGDPIIMKSDGFPTYHLANVVDDHLMKISHVFRGVEWQVSTPKHILLYKALGWTPPKFGHLPVIMNADGTKLSKRQGDVHLEHYKAQGYLPEALRIFVISTGGGFSDFFKESESTYIYSTKELQTAFDIFKLRTNSSQLNFDKLDAVNRVAIAQRLNDTSNEQQSALISLARSHLVCQFQQIEVTDAQILQVLKWGSDRISKMSDLTTHVDFAFLWKRPNVWEDLPIKDINILQTAIGTIEKIDIKEFEVANKAIRKLCKKNGFAYANVMKCVRIFLIGQSQGPPIKDIISQLGQKEALIRLKSGLDNCLLNKSAGEE